MPRDWIVAFKCSCDEHGLVHCPICAKPATSKLQVTSMLLYQCAKGHRWTAYRMDWTVAGNVFWKMVDYLTPKR